MTDKHYAVRDAMEMDIAGNHYCRHVSAMTSEGLHSKADIAAELGWRDWQIAQLQEQVKALSAENCIQAFIIAAVKDLVRDSEGVIGWHLNGDVATWDEVLPELSHSETPDTDAIIREIGAKAVEQLSREAYENGAYGVAMIATQFAAQLRAKPAEAGDE